MPRTINQGMSWDGAGGPARPIHFSYDGPRPGPAHHIQRIGYGPAQPMTLAARPMRHGLLTGRPAISVSWPVDLTGRATGWPMCCYYKVKAYGLTCFVVVHLFLVYFSLWIPWASP